ncbi:class I SAM-dependent methyltransferase [Candidatus Parcubacteria bacterium]|nr:class I SAM-dependent methyltransferase [Patescibacteria group bacterium]MBU4381045.1 class I SAM-dependent methyltransferase [Patescibacteria group bacterium]MCG2689052.1 class I SAM-dependent methyltransferase [Candidatus Parcubacteria bacterium]
MKPADYNDPNYDYTKYWSGREYEDLAEKRALKKLLPLKGTSILDVGGGFGRLAPLYSKTFSKITLTDSSTKILAQAVKFTKTKGMSIKTVKSDVYNLAENLNGSKFDCVIMIRVVHHLDNLADAFKQVATVLENDGVFILEYANKLNFKAVVRNIAKFNLKHFDLSPVSIATKSKVNFCNFHPQFVEEALGNAGFRIEKKLSVSNLRSPLLKKYFADKTLAEVESRLQEPLSCINFGPSVFLKCVKD